jgi:hypothetical protein
VLIKSEDRFNLKSTKPTNFQIRFDEPVDGRYEVRWVTIPNTIYNISTTNNTFTANGSLLTIPPGSYNGSSIAGELTTQLDTLGGAAAPYTVGFNPLTFKLSVTTTDASATTFLGTGTANKSLGLPTTDTVIASGGVMPNVLFLGFPLSLGIKITQSSSCGYVTGGGGYQTTTETVAVNGQSTGTQVFVSDEKQATMIIPLLAESNFYNWTSFNDFKQWITIEKGTKVLDITVVDSRTGQEVELNGGAWEMLIDRTEKNVTKKKKKRQRTTSAYRNT